MTTPVCLAELAASLPIGEVLEAVVGTLAQHNELVLEAPPGAGKTTVVPLALLDSGWLAERKIIMLEPRRVAVRAAAARMAALLGEPVGRTVGYRVRFDSQVSAATRIEVVTEGVLGRLLIDDPALARVGLLIFDEFHERSLDADVGLALALQGRELFRESPDPLKLLVMSATLDGVRVAELLGAAPRLTSAGRAFPVAVEHIGHYRPGVSMVEPVVEQVLRVLREERTAMGSVLVFLPGQREIAEVALVLHRRIAHWPEALGANVVVESLHGGLGLEAQQRAIAPAPRGRRKVVLATNIAQTSLTIPGVDAVIDSGLVREPCFDPRTGVTRLKTRLVSRDASVQRSGRAGRVRPGRCVRLWSESQQQQLVAQGVPEILQADLLPLALQLLAWGVDDPAQLRWLDAPPSAALAQATERLASLGALEHGARGSRCLTAHGARIAQLPIHPRLGHMVLRALAIGFGDLACDIAALLADSRPGPHGGVDVAQQLRYLSGVGTGGSAAQAWRRRVMQHSKQLRRRCGRLRRRVGADSAAASAPDRLDAPGLLLAWAFPDRIARRRQAGSPIYQMANGRAVALGDTAEGLCRSEWIVVADLGGQIGQAHDRVFRAVALQERLFAPGADGLLSDLLCRRREARWDDDAQRFSAQTQVCLGALVISREPLDVVPLETKRQALMALLVRRGLQVLPWTDALRQWQGRVMLLRAHWRPLEPSEGNPWPDVSDQGLLNDLEGWLGSALDPVERLPDFQRLDLAALLSAMLPWPLPRQLDEWAPTHWRAPSGSLVAIDYRVDPPVVAVKLQEMFGATEGPRVARGAVAVTLHLLSPARRPLQITTDLAGFWAGSYQQVKKEMKGRYPKHPWPDDPLGAEPTRATRQRGKR